MLQVQVLAEPGRFEAGELPEPETAPGEVLIRVAAVAICGSDLSAFRGTHPAILPPTVIGHEFSGTIDRVGPEVGTFEVGQPVVVDPTFGCGACRHCRNGRANICSRYRVMGRQLHDPGAMAGLVAVPADHVYPLPERIGLEAAALVQPISVGYHAAVHRGAVAPGDVVLIAGAGAIGIGILMAVKEVGARAIVSDFVASRRDLASELGADLVVNPGEGDLAEIVGAETDGYGVDVAFEAVGGSTDAILGELVDLTTRGGTVVVVGLKTDVARIPMKDVKYAEKTITGSQAHPDSFPSVIERIADGRFPAGRLISHRVPFSRAAEAFRILDGRQEGVMKVVLLPD